MNYVRKFVFHRLILFLLVVCLFSGLGMLVFVWSSMNWMGIIIGVCFFILMEYAVHRYLLHEFPGLLPSAYRGHVAHHMYPEDAKHLFGAINYDLVGYLVYFMVGWLVTQRLSLTFAIIFGSVLCQVFYQWMHFIAHRPIMPLTAWSKRMKKKHLLHHHLDEHAWYGVSNPIMDAIMRTNVPSSKKGQDDADHRINSNRL